MEGDVNVDISEVKAQIKSKKFDRFYIFAGEEYKVLNIYIDKICEGARARKVYADSIIDVVSNSRQNSLIKNTTLYVIMDDKEFLSNEKAWEFVEKDQTIKDDILVFYYTSIDKRKKFWKYFDKRVVTFDHLDKRLLTRYIQKDIPLTVKNCEELIDICENDYGRILLEIDKIKSFPSKDKADTVFGHLIKDGTIYISPKDAIFDFVNAVLDRDVELAYDLLDQSYAVGEANMVLISVLYNSFKNLLLVQTRKNKEDIGLNGWQIKNVINYVNNYSTGEIIRALKVLRSIEVGIKRGEMPDSISVNYFLVSVI